MYALHCSPCFQGSGSGLGPCIAPPVAVFGFWFSGFSLGFSGFEASDLENGVGRLGRAAELGHVVGSGLVFRVSGSGFRVSCFVFRVSGSGFRVSGSGFRVSNTAR